MKDLTIVLLNNNINIDTNNIETINYNKENFLYDLRNIKSKYLTFLKDNIDLDDNYLSTIIEKTKEEFDSCFINYTIEIDNKKYAVEEMDVPEVNKVPYQGSYIWSFIYNKEKLIELIDSSDYSKENIEKIFSKRIGIKEPLLNHHHGSNKIINDFIYTDEKKEVKRKNIFYLGTFCNGRFNGYITWLNNLGRCFGDDFDMTIIYDEINDITKERFERYFELIKREEDTLYLADRLFVTYSTYYYPKNLLKLEKNYLFIHGNMCDYKRARKYHHNNYDQYIGVSKACADKAVGYFPTDHIDYILNPIKIDQSEVKPHLKLVSAQRLDPIKRVDRIHNISRILDEENIPYTWNVFIDKKPYEKGVYGGVVYRRSVINPLPYINDADYYVQLSDSEAFCYSVAEALSLNTKVVVTPLDCYKELKIDEEQGFIIPFEYFDEENKDQLRIKVLEMYQNIKKPMQNKLDPSMYSGYKEILKK